MCDQEFQLSTHFNIGSSLCSEKLLSLYPDCIMCEMVQSGLKTPCIVLFGI